MYYFFETFVNKIINVSVEVETHSLTSAFIMSRSELEEILAELIRDFINYNTVVVKTQQKSVFF